MADDTILEVGALINLEQFLPGIEKMASSTVAATSSMTGSFLSMTGVITSNTAQIGSQFAVIPATLTKLDATVARTGTTTSSSTRAIGLSFSELANTIRNSMASIFGSLSGLDARIAKTAERSGLEVGAMKAGFAGLSSFLGAGIAVGFAAHFLDEAARVEVQLGHISAASAISVQTLAGLRAAVQQTGMDFEPFERGLIRMQRAQVLAVENNVAMQQAFHRLGLEMDQVKSMTPEQLFLALAKAMSESKKTQLDAASATQIFSRGGIMLIPILKELSERAKANNQTLEQYIEILGKQSGITDESVRTAQEWTRATAQLSQHFQALLIPVIGLVMKIMLGWQSIIVMVKATLDDLGLKGVVAFKNLAIMAEGAGKAIVAAFTPGASVAGVWEDAMRQIRLNNDITADQVTAIWDAAYAKIKDIVKEPPVIAKPTGEGLDDLTPKLKTSEIISQWKEALDQMRDAQTGFHELSKADEAKFWADKLAIARTNATLYREVYHLYIEAERAARKEALGEEIASVEERLAAEKTGSLNRVTILGEELEHLRSIGAEETAEYKRVTVMFTTALKDADAENEREFTKSQDKLIAETKSGTQERVNIIKNAMKLAMSFYGEDSDAYKKFDSEKTRADEELKNKNIQIKVLELEATANHAKASLEITKSRVETEFEIGAISAKERIRQLEIVANAELAIDKKLIEAKQALYDVDSVEYQRLEKAKVAATDKTDKEINTIETGALKERVRKWQTAAQQIQQDFSNAIGQMLRGQKTFGQAMAEVWDNMVVKFAQDLANMLIKWLAHQAMKLLAAQAGEAAQTTVAAEGEGQRDTVGIAGAIKSIMRAAARAAAHAFMWVYEEVPWPVNTVLAPIAAAAAFTGVMAFGALAGTAEKGALLENDALIAAHAKEMILPAPISVGIQNAIASGTFNPPPALTQNFVTNTAAATAAAVGKTSVSHHTVNVSPEINYHQHGGTGPNMDELHDTIVKSVRTAIRRGQLLVGPRYV